MTPHEDVKMLDKYLDASLEAATGEPELEKELCFLVKLKDLEELKKADKVIAQEQWCVMGRTSEGKTDKNVMVRVRAENGEYFTLTTKTRVSSDSHYVETEMETCEAVFDAMRRVAEDGMKKTRYVFNHGESAWEIDCFVDAYGQPLEYVKIDYEYTGEAPDIADLPVAFSNPINLRDENDRDQHKDAIDHFFASGVLKNRSE